MRLSGSVFDANQHGCPKCDGRGYVSFNWQMAQERKGHAIDKYPKYLRLERALKFGFQYGCPVCSTKWFLDDFSKLISIIPESRLVIFEEWNNRELYLSEEMLAIANSIGATPPDVYGNGGHLVEVPCEVLTRTGEIFERAILSFQKNPPINFGDADVRLIDSIEQVRPSKFSLSREVRYATAQASEIRMCFSPTLVKSSEGDIYVLNGVTNFIWESDLEGEEFSVFDGGGTKNSRDAIQDINAITYFVGDWFPHAEHLRIV